MVWMPFCLKSYVSSKANLFSKRFAVAWIIGLLIGLWGCAYHRYPKRLSAIEQQAFIDANTVCAYITCDASQDISQLIEEDCLEVLQNTRLRVVDDEDKADVVLVLRPRNKVC